jgi:hypothetical protein
MDASALRATTTELIGDRLQRLQTTAIGLVVVGAVLCGIGAVMNPRGFFPSYLSAYLLWFGITAGSLGLLMLHHVVGGGWGFVIRRFLEAAASQIVLIALLFLPILAGMSLFGLFPWADAGSSYPDIDHIRQIKGSYLNAPFFLGRAVAYFAILMFLTHRMLTWGAEQYERTDLANADRLNRWGAFGILVYVLTITFVSVDWIMSLTPEWTTSILGLLMTAAHALSAMSLMLILVGSLGGDDALVRRLPREYFRDLGNLTLAMVLMWAYLSFSQWVITYSGNMVEEVGWYLRRANGGWGIVSLGLIFVHFFAPFFILLVWSEGKRSPVLLARIAAWLLLARFIDLWWWVVPTSRPQIGISLADVGAPLLLGGIWLFCWARAVRDKPIVPLQDPRLQAHLGEVASHG